MKNNTNTIKNAAKLAVRTFISVIKDETETTVTEAHKFVMYSNVKPVNATQIAFYCSDEKLENLSLLADKARKNYSGEIDRLAKMTIENSPFKHNQRSIVRKAGYEMRLAQNKQYEYMRTKADQFAAHYQVLRDSDQSQARHIENIFAAWSEKHEPDLYRDTAVVFLNFSYEAAEYKRKKISAQTKNRSTSLHAVSNSESA